MHPCQSCGACCAHYRVSLHWSEAEPSLGGRTPVALTEPCGPHVLAMRGTWQAQPHCVALVGEVGTRVGCSIYEDRPSPCRTLQASWEHGFADAQCDRARHAYGLAPLTPAAWNRPDPA